jgi:hypothetical protein
MTPEMSSAPELEPELAPKSEMARLTGVFFEPSQTFADIAERPRWFVPMALLILATVAFYATFGQRVGWLRLVQDQLASSSRYQQQASQMTAAQRENVVNLYVKFYPVLYEAGPVLGIPLLYLIIAAVLLGMASGLMSAGIRFKQMFAIVCYAGVVGALAKLLAIVVMFLKSPDEYNVMNPLAFNPAAYMDPRTASRFVYTLASGLDLFVLWSLALEAVGIKAAAGKRISTGGAVCAAAIPYGVLLLFGATMAGLFS